MGSTATQTGYAPVNGLNMYYEIHGSGSPLVMLHGAYGWVDGNDPLLATLAESRQVIAVEFQAHGRTADIDRPLSYEAMADDTAALMRHLNIGQADIFGYSMGGGVAIQLAVRDPELVRKLVIVSAGICTEGGHPEMWAAIETITPEVFAGSPMEEAYLRLAPDKEGFPILVNRLKQLDMEHFSWPAEDIRSITAPVLYVVGDSDAVILEHAVEVFRLLGGGVMGDLAGMPVSQFAILPGTNHMDMFLGRSDWLVALANPFLDAPMPDAE
jgi:pimeloyl-ACP methyl ester carboxylesterase